MYTMIPLRTPVTPALQLKVSPSSLQSCQWSNWPKRDSQQDGGQGKCVPFLHGIMQTWCSDKGMAVCGYHELHLQEYISICTQCWNVTGNR